MAQPISFSADEMRILKEERILLPASSNLSASHGSVFSSSSGSTASVSFKHYVLDPSIYLEIPLAEEIPEALEYFGFTAEVAQKIYADFSHRPQNTPIDDDILEWVYACADSLNLPALSNLSPNKALTRLGVKKSLRDGILDPEFRHIFETQSLLFWVKDSLRINYWTLVGLQGRLKEHAKHVSKSKAKKSKHGSMSEVFPAAGSSSFEPRAPISVESSSKHLPKACVLVQEPGPILEDHIVLYKSKAAAELVDEFQWIQDDGTLNMMALTSSPFGDFNFGSIAWCFAPDRETAEQYRRYVARRHENSETWLIRIQVPKTFLNSMSTRSLWYGPEWREYVWHCRTRTPPSSKYDSLWKTGPGSAQVIRGAICSAASRKVMKIKRDQIHELMTEQEVVMKCGTQDAKQVVFMQVDAATSLGEEANGKVHIEVFPLEAARMLKRRYH